MDVEGREVEGDEVGAAGGRKLKKPGPIRSKGEGSERPAVFSLLECIV